MASKDRVDPPAVHRSKSMQRVETPYKICARGEIGKRIGFKFRTTAGSNPAGRTNEKMTMATQDEIKEMLDHELHVAIGAAREWFLSNGFDLEGDNAVMSSGYGSGPMVVEIIPLVKTILKEMRAVRR
jgi:hypothetical protein